MANHNLQEADDDEAPEIDGGEPVKGPVYRVKSTDEGYVLDTSEDVNA